MKQFLFVVLATIACSTAFGAPILTQNDYQVSFAKASAAADKALAMHAAWTVTETALQSARKAAADQHFDQAVVLAQQAEALAQASIRQAEEQKTAWRAAVVK